MSGMGGKRTGYFPFAPWLKLTLPTRHGSNADMLGESARYPSEARSN